MHCLVVNLINQKFYTVFKNLIALGTKRKQIFLVRKERFNPEVESSSTSLASRTSSRTHFEVLGHEAQVLGLGLKKASILQKLPCSWLEDSTIFLSPQKFIGKRQKPRRNFVKTFFVFLFGRSPEKKF